jgi:hypothetical protein
MSTCVCYIDRPDGITIPGGTCLKREADSGVNILCQYLPGTGKDFFFFSLQYAEMTEYCVESFSV